MAAKRNQALDVLRGVAILLVIGHHYVLCNFVYQVGWSGVDLFFVLSGFLISGLLFDEFKTRGRIDVKRFWIRRGFKIYPLFYLLTGLTALALLDIHKLNLTKLLSETFFVQDYIPHIWGHTWSLAVEEHFYFLLPLLLLALAALFRGRRDPFFLMPWLFAVVAAGCLLLRWRGVEHGVLPFTLHSETHLRMDSLFAGVFLSYLCHFRSRVFSELQRLPILAPAALFLAPMALLPMDGGLMTTAGLSALYCGYGLLLVWAVGKPYSKNPAIRSVAWLGRYSYSIYLWHMPIREVIYRGHIGFWFFVEGMLISVPVGVLFSELAEKPSLALRERLFPRKSGENLTTILGGAGSGAKSHHSASAEVTSGAA